MAPITKTLALAGALFAACGFAAPVEKRDVVWVTVTDVVWTTVDVTTTVYPEQLGATTATVEPVTTTPAAPAVPTTTAAPQQESETQSQQQAAPAPAPQPETSAPAPAPAPQPETTTAPAPAPAPQPTEQTTVIPEPTTTSQAPAAPTSSSTADTSSSGSGYNGSCDESSPCVGQMTYYDTATTATNPSACGTTNDGLTELVLALPVGMMTDADCGKSVTIEYNGVTQTGKVVDKCMGCDNTSIDLSRALFESFASLSAGRISGAKWYIN